MNWKLTDKEIEAIPVTGIGNEDDKNVAKAAQKKLLGYLRDYEDSCPECGCQINLEAMGEEWRKLCKELE